MKGPSIERLAEVDRRLRDDTMGIRWAWALMAGLLAFGAIYALATGQWLVGAAVAYGAALAAARPVHTRDAYLAGYSAGWSDRTELGR